MIGENYEWKGEKGKGAAACPLPVAMYFGGKARIAPLVWDRLGDVSNFIEPFCGSAAILLGRPDPPRIETVNDPTLMIDNAWRATHPETGDAGAVAEAACEVINDLDPYLANVWRSLKEAPEETALWADAPVVESYMHAVHRWLVLGDEAAAFRRRMRDDPDYFDPKRAGRYLFGASCWIASGWCSAPLSGKKPRLASGPDGNAGQGIHPDKIPVKRPLLAGPANEQGERSHYGLGVHAKGGIDPQVFDPLSDTHRPQLADVYSRGRGVHGNDAAGTCEQRRAWLIDWLSRLRDRLRTVRVCCGHWKRVCDSPSVTTRLGITGILMDPPYPSHNADGTESRTAGLYATDGDRDELDKLRDEVLAYCRERGSDPRMRLCIAAYDTDGYDALIEHGWDVVAWKASGGYGCRSDKGRTNAARERLYYSPHCLKPGADLPLFAGKEV